MTQTLSKTEVRGAKEVEKTFVRRKGRFLLFFETEWWEEVACNAVGNDIYIETQEPIRNIYLNGKPVTTPRHPN